MATWDYDMHSGLQPWGGAFQCWCGRDPLYQKISFKRNRIILKIYCPWSLGSMRGSFSFSAKVLKVLKVNPWAGASNTLMDQSKTPGRNVSIYAYKNTPVDWSVLRRGGITPTVKTWMQRRPSKHAQNLNSNSLLMHAVWHERFQLLLGHGHKGTPVTPFSGMLCARHWGTQG